MCSADPLLNASESCAEILEKSVSAAQQDEKIERALNVLNKDWKVFTIDFSSLKPVGSKVFPSDSQKSLIGDEEDEEDDVQDFEKMFPAAEKLQVSREVFGMMYCMVLLEY